MSNKQRKSAKIAARGEKEQQHGSTVVKWIFGALLLLAIGFVCYTMWLTT